MDNEYLLHMYIFIVYNPSCNFVKNTQTRDKMTQTRTQQPPLKDTLIAINSQSKDQLKSAKVIVSHHLIFLLKGKEGDWTYSEDISSSQKKYTKAVQLKLIEVRKREYAELVALENRLNKENKNNLKGIAEFYWDESNRLFVEQEIGKNIKVSEMSEEVKFHVETKETYSPPVKMILPKNSLHRNRFFKEANTSIYSHIPLHTGISEIIAEYAMNEHDVALRITMVDITINIQKDIEKACSDSIEFFAGQDVYRKLIAIVLNHLKTLIYFYIPENHEKTNIILFGFYEKNFIEGLPLNNLSPEEQCDVVEIFRAFSFLNQPSLHDLDKNYIRIYALKAHIEKCHFNLVETAQLFNCFFHRILPLLSKTTNIKCSEDICYHYMLDDHWYNNHIYAMCNSAINMSHLNQQNYQHFLTQTLQSTDDSLKQFVAITETWRQMRGGISEEEFLTFVAQHAKNGIHAASAWVLLPVRSRDIQISYKKLVSWYLQLSMSDLFLLMKNATRLAFEVADFWKESINNIVACWVENNNIDQIIPFINNLRKDPNEINIPLVGIQIFLLHAVNEHRPDLYNQLIPLKLEIIDTINSLMSNSEINPICRNSGMFEDHLKELSQLQDNNEQSSSTSNASCLNQVRPV